MYLSTWHRAATTSLDIFSRAQTQHVRHAQLVWKRFAGYRDLLHRLCLLDILLRSVTCVIPTIKKKKKNNKKKTTARALRWQIVMSSLNTLSLPLEGLSWRYLSLTLEWLVEEVTVCVRTNREETPFESSDSLALNRLWLTMKIIILIIVD